MQIGPITTSLRTVPVSETQIVDYRDPAPAPPALAVAATILGVLPGAVVGAVTAGG